MRLVDRDARTGGRQGNVVTLGQLLEAGLFLGAIEHRVGTRGRAGFSDFGGVCDLHNTSFDAPARDRDRLCILGRA